MSIYKKLREAVNEVRKVNYSEKDKENLKNMQQAHGDQETPEPETPSDEESEKHFIRLQAEKRRGK